MVDLVECGKMKGRLRDAINGKGSEVSRKVGVGLYECSVWYAEPVNGCFTLASKVLLYLMFASQYYLIYVVKFIFYYDFSSFLYVIQKFKIHVLSSTLKFDS